MIFARKIALSGRGWCVALAWSLTCATATCQPTTLRESPDDLPNTLRPVDPPPVAVPSGDLRQTNAIQLEFPPLNVETLPQLPLPTFPPPDNSATGNPFGSGRRAADAAPETAIKIKTTAPSAEELFRLDTEQAFRERIRQESARLSDKVKIPELRLPALSPLPRTRGWNDQYGTLEPDHLCFGRQIFLTRPDERYGRNLGPLQPLVSTSWFCFDLAKMPIATVTHPFTFYQCDDHRDLRKAPYPCR